MNDTKQSRTGIKNIDYAEHKFIRLNDADYCYLEAGTGPMVLLLHGYPDNAYSWEHQIRFLAQSGYRVIVPFTRGYAPTTTGPASYFDRATLARDMVALIDELNQGEPVLLVGQDWGAAISYGILGAFPDKVRRAMVLAVPHPAEINRTLKRSPRHCIRSFHWFLFQLPWLPEKLIRWTRGGFLSFLWRLWSPDFKDGDHVDQVIAAMLQGSGIEDTLAYYRAAIQSAYRDPELADVFQRLNNPIPVPTRVLCGQQDMRREMLPRAADLFTPAAQYQWGLVDNAGHFLHREQPAVVNAEIAQWFAIETALTSES
ncbi:MAG: alpha/beta hydrolase [Candidatus Pelagadaptatus aseana]|uniref:alpha/beta fold hydrolase n=1 Tax=Candidatus Pelagadaptatus aseana TaxID=3120508 RepID=UPI0039B2D713